MGMKERHGILAINYQTGVVDTEHYDNERIADAVRGWVRIRVCERSLPDPYYGGQDAGRLKVLLRESARPELTEHFRAAVEGAFPAAWKAECREVTSDYMFLVRKLGVYEVFPKIAEQLDALNDAGERDRHEFFTGLGWNRFHKQPKIGTKDADLV